MQSVFEIAHLTDEREQDKVQRGNKAACRFGQVCFSAEPGGCFRLQHREQCGEHGGAMNAACVHHRRCKRGQGCDFSPLRHCPYT